MAIAHGASAIGLVSEMPSGPGVIPEALIAEIAASVPAGHRHLPADLPQAVGRDRRAAAAHPREHHPDLRRPRRQARWRALRAALPGVALVQVIHVDGEEAIDARGAVAPAVDAILLDSGNQKLAVKELGGTGRRHDWTISRRIREQVEVPVYLAGGLTAGQRRGGDRHRGAVRARRLQRRPHRRAARRRPGWRPSSPR